MIRENQYSNTFLLRLLVSWCLLSRQPLLQLNTSLFQDKTSFWTSVSLRDSRKLVQLFTEKSADNLVFSLATVFIFISSLAVSLGTMSLKLMPLSFAHSALFCKLEENRSSFVHWNEQAEGLLPVKLVGPYPFNKAANKHEGDLLSEEVLKWGVSPNAFVVNVAPDSRRRKTLFRAFLSMVATVVTLVSL